MVEKILLRKEKVNLAVSIAEEMLKNGGEVYRVDDTVKRILAFYGFKEYHVYIVSNGIFVTVDESGDNPISCVRDVPSWSVNLEKIAKLNNLSRDVCQGKCPVENAYSQLEDIRNMRQRSELTLRLATGVGSAAFCFLFGGRGFDMALAFVVGFILKLFLSMAESRQVSKFIRHIFGSLLVSVLAAVSHMIFPVIQVDKVIIAGILILVPGVALTTSIRDFFGGDYLSGSIHLIDALLTAVCIATGVGVAMKACAVLGIV